MTSVTDATEALASVVHTLTSLSIIITHLVHNDLLAALDVTVTGCVCLVVITLVASGCEIVRWKVRQYLRTRELTERKPDVQKLKG